MPVPTPSSADLGRIAERIGYRIDPDRSGSTRPWSRRCSAAYDAIDSVEETPVLATRARVESRVPTAEEDPHHTWYVRTSIRGAAEGPLAGVRLAVKDSVMVAGVPMMNGATCSRATRPTSTRRS